jgi:hypothetical protein
MTLIAGNQPASALLLHALSTFKGLVREALAPQWP